MCGICGKINKNYIWDGCKNQIDEIILNNIDLNEDKYFSKHLYLFKYEGIIREKIIEYKFEDKAYLYKFFEKIIINNKKICDFIKSYDIIIPVPISKERKKERGYNQTSLIARSIADDFDKIIFGNSVIIKEKNIQRQSELNKEQRIENVKNSFKIKEDSNIKDKKVLIFDDIYTTGSTVNECAKALKEAGTKEIGVLTIAKD